MSREVKEKRYGLRFLACLLAAFMVFTILPVSAAETYAEEAADSVDPSSLAGNNWMSGISDDKYLYEINIPGTHDSCMKWAFSAGDISALVPQYAITQEMSIPEQLNAGVRLFDIRVTDSYLGRETDNKTYLCHGKPDAIECRFYALACAPTPRPFYGYTIWTPGERTRLYSYNYLYLETILQYYTDFLKNNPTETLILDISYESGSGDEAKSYAKARSALTKWYMEKNPATGKSYIYSEDNNRILSKMPRLRDTRGQIVILSGSTEKLGYGLQYGTGNSWGDTTIGGVPFSFENHYEANDTYKLQYVQAFFNGGTVGKWDGYAEATIEARKEDLKKDLTEHQSHGNIICTTANQAWTDFKKMGSSPKTVAEKVNPWLYTDANALFKTRGVFYGWIYSDFINANDTKTLWLTNYPEGDDGLKYSEVRLTYKGAGSEDVLTQTETIQTGSSVTLAENTFAEPDLYEFAGWKIEGDTALYQPGDAVAVSGEKTITAQWKLTWYSFNRYIQRNKNKIIDITLEDDLIAGSCDRAISIPAGTTVNLDLNGHTINRKWSDHEDGIHEYSGNVFSVIGTLNLTGPGTITGGYANYGGGFNVGSIEKAGVYGSLKLENVTVTGNTATENGGGVFVGKKAKFSVSGSTVISGNTDCDGNSNNVYLDESAANNKIVVKGTLIETAEIGITGIRPSGSQSVVLTKGLNGKGTSAAFRSDSGVYTIYTNEKGEAEIALPVKVTLLGGGTPVTYSALPGAYLERPKDPIRMDPYLNPYTFTGWYTDSSCKVLFDFEKPVYKNTILYAGWSKENTANTEGLLLDETEESEQYTVTFDSRGGNSVEPQTIEKNGTAVKPEDPLREGYEFIGWYLKLPDLTPEEAEALNAGSNYLVIEGEDVLMPFEFDLPVYWNYELYAGWKAYYTLTFDPDSSIGEPFTQIVYEGELPIEPAAQESADYIFRGWYTSQEYTQLFDFTVPVSENADIYAAWCPGEFQVFFDSNGAEEIPSQTVLYGNTAVQPADPVKEGSTFAGWYELMTDITMDEVNAILEKEPEAERYLWFDGEDILLEYGFENSVETDCILRARWTDREYTVTFMDPGYEEWIYDTEIVSHGDTVAEPENSEYFGSDFAGWYSDTALTRVYDFSLPVTQDLILYGKWAQENYTVTFDSNGGSEVESQKVGFFETVEKPEDPVREGYCFEGWYALLDYEYDEETIREYEDLYANTWFMDGKDAYKFDFDVMIPCSDMTLIARWSEEGLDDLRDEAVVQVAQLDELVTPVRYTAFSYQVYQDASSEFKKTVLAEDVTKLQIRNVRAAVTKAYLALEKKASQSLTVTAKTKTVNYSTILAKSLTYNALKVSGNQGALTFKKVSGSTKYASVNASSGKITILQGTPAGTYTIKVKAASAATDDYLAASETVTATITVFKASQSMTVTANGKTVKYSKLSKAKQTVSNAVTVTDSVGTLTYAKVSGSSSLTVNSKNGKITVKKGTAKGTYKIKIRVTAAGNKNYKAKSRTVTVRIKVQ